MMDIGTQEPLPGLEDYICTFRCLEHCPFPDGPCPWDDPDFPSSGLLTEYPRFFDWRLDHLTDEQRKQLMEPGSDFLILTPDSLDEFYPEPEGNPYRCPRCLATDLTFDDAKNMISCNKCGYNEPLIDFPENIGLGGKK